MAGPRKKRKEENGKRGNIENMIRSMPSKKNTNTAAIKDDDILGELLSEISACKKTTNRPKPTNNNKNKFCHTVHSDIT